jgi:hypothetical protein
MNSYVLRSWTHMYLDHDSWGKGWEGSYAYLPTYMHKFPPTLKVHWHLVLGILVSPNIILVIEDLSLLIMKILC